MSSILDAVKKDPQRAAGSDFTASGESFGSDPGGPGGSGGSPRGSGGRRRALVALVVVIGFVGGAMAARFFVSRPAVDAGEAGALVKAEAPVKAITGSKVDVAAKARPAITAKAQLAVKPSAAAAARAQAAAKSRPAVVAKAQAAAKSRPAVVAKAQAAAKARPTESARAQAAAKAQPAESAKAQLLAKAQPAVAARVQPEAKVQPVIKPLPPAVIQTAEKADAETKNSATVEAESPRESKPVAGVEQVAKSETASKAAGVIVEPPAALRVPVSSKDGPKSDVEAGVAKIPVPKPGEGKAMAEVHVAKPGGGKAMATVHAPKPGEGKAVATVSVIEPGSGKAGVEASAVEPATSSLQASVAKPEQPPAAEVPAVKAGAQVVHAPAVRADSPVSKTPAIKPVTSAPAFGVPPSSDDVSSAQASTGVSTQASAAVKSGGESEPAGLAPLELDKPPAGSPKVDLLFIMWADAPARRLVSMRLDGGSVTIAREGDIVGSGMRVSSIRPDAVDFTWTGRRFRIAVNRY